MRPFRPRQAVLEAGLAAVSGFLLYLAMLVLEGLGDLLFAPGSPEAARRALFALIEEGAKLGLLLAFGLRFGAGGPRRRGADALRLGAARGLSLGIAAVAVFAAIENLAYFAASPGWGAAGRLLWSEPVHLVSALALSLGLFPLVSGRGGPAGRSAARAAPAIAGGFALAYAWHLAANLAASGLLLPRAAEAPGGAARLLAAGSILNAAALWALVRLYLHKAVIGGFLYGKE
ncbi:MAG TPA: hypothetical protein PLG14_00905 [Spirochaetales bacterium]|nr:hypothetical protein [Spirochaetales bacterium]